MKKKRLLASIVTAAMLFTMVPSYALADDSAVPMIELVPATPTESTQTDVPDSTECTMTADCTAEVHQEGCPAAQPEEDTCTMSADCAAEEHQEGCPAAKPVVDEPETETEQTPEPRTDAVAKIGDTSYTSLDEAVKEAVEGATIELLADCELTEGFNKTLTFTGKGKISIPKQLKSNGEAWMCFGLGDTNRVLTFDGEGVEVEWMADSNASWLMLSLSGTLNVTNGASLTFKFDSQTTKTTTAIYMNAGAELNVTSGSTFQILGTNTEGTIGQGIQLDKTAQSDINVTGGSTFLIDGTNRGYVNSPNIYVEDSSFTVQNCTNNASNGGHFEAVRSEVRYTDNAGHGLSAGDVILEASSLLSQNNGLYGVYVNGDFKVDGKSKLEVIGNSYGGDCAGLNLTAAVTNGLVESGAEVKITDNKCSGFSSRGVCEFEEGVKLTIMNNVNDKGSASHGGGIYNTKDTARLILPSDAVIYNNHAVTSGDDIYNTGTITFSKVGSGWTLDDCDHDITGWYDDSAGNRWQGDEEPYHINEFDQFEKLTGTTTVVGPLALKAAHGVAPIETEPTYWEKSKSKTASELVQTEDGLYESNVTLSLPAAQETLESDVVFVLDKSTSADVEDQMIKMLEDLNAQAQETGAVINVGVVIFNKEAHRELELTQLTAENMGKIEAAIRTTISSGTNTHAGLLAGKNMLDADADVDANRKYLIFVSDGITYMYNEEPTVTAWSFFADAWNTWAGPDNWNSKYGTNEAPNNWNTWMTNIGVQVAAQGTTYEYPYGGTVQLATPQENWKTYANSIDKALYLTNSVYQDAQSAGYHCYALKASSNAEYAWASSFMDYLADEKAVSFEDIQNDIYYLLSSGSQVVDVIGSGIDNKDNPYNFDFVNNIDKLTLKVGEETLSKTELIDPQFNDPYITSAYGFGELVSNDDGEMTYPFILKYYVKGQNGNSDECFVWDINVPVSNFAPVQLTYTVKLTNPKTEPGTYGVYDADGSEKKDSLHTNNSATLYPVDSNGDEGVPENFAKPTVSYTVEDPTITVTFKPGDHGDLRGAEAGADISYDGIKKGTGLGEDQAVPRVDEDKDWDFTNWLCIEGSAGMKDQTYTAAQIAEREFDVDTVFVAQYEEESSGGGAHHPEYDPDDDNDRDDDDDEEEIIDEEVPLAETPWLNTVDHYAYIVGYPEDYVTGQPTEDESRWPVKPQANISRAEVATIFFRLLTDEARDQFWMTTNNFPDIAPDAWYNNAISTMVNAGIIQGYEDGTFRPNNNITRAEFAAIASRFMSSGYDVEEDLFTDIANHWARENINDAAMTQWIHGYPDGTFLPDQAITRAEAVTLVNNVLQRKPHKDHMLDTMIKWPDNPESAWYYEAIQEATNSHDYDLFEDAEYETWTALQENRDWAALEKDWANAHSA